MEVQTHPRRQQPTKLRRPCPKPFLRLLTLSFAGGRKYSGPQCHEGGRDKPNDIKRLLAASPSRSSSGMQLSFPRISPTNSCLDRRATSAPDGIGTLKNAKLRKKTQSCSMDCSDSRAWRPLLATLVGIFGNPWVAGVIAIVSVGGPTAAAAFASNKPKLPNPT